MAKPILVCRLPFGSDETNFQETLNGLQTGFGDDYKILIVGTNIAENVDFQFAVLNADKIDPVQLDDFIKEAHDTILKFLKK